MGSHRTRRGSRLSQLHPAQARGKQRGRNRENRDTRPDPKNCTPAQPWALPSRLLFTKYGISKLHPSHLNAIFSIEDPQEILSVSDILWQWTLCYSKWWTLGWENRQKVRLLASCVPVWLRAKLHPKQSHFITHSEHNPLHQGLSRGKYKVLFQMQKIYMIFQIYFPLYLLNAWPSEVHMNHPNSFPTQYANWHKIHLNKLFKFAKTQIIFSFSRSFFCRIKRD